MIVECDHCSALVDAEILKSYSITDHVAPTLLISFARCPRCQSPFIASQEEDFGPNEWQLPTLMYPQQSTGLSKNLPVPIVTAFDEAIRCMRSKAYTAAAIMCRKTLEGICAAHNAESRNLAQSLKVLRDNETIDRRLFEWAEELRLFGNEAAHDVNVTITASDAQDIVDFTRALIEYVFTFRDRFESFKQRRESKNQRNA